MLDIIEQMNKAFGMEDEFANEEKIETTNEFINVGLDSETLRKIKEFAKNNPEKIRRWQLEDDERRKNCVNIVRYRPNKHVNERVDKPDVNIVEMLTFCGKGSGFVNSLRTWYNEKKYLTPKQKDALKRIYDGLKVKNDRSV